MSRGVLHDFEDALDEGDRNLLVKHVTGNPSMCLCVRTENPSR
jgi:hypothetical protein